MRIVLLDGGKVPLATFGDRLSGKAAKEVERLGVELRMGAHVTGVDAAGVDISDAVGATSRLAAYTTVWAAGVEASPLATELAKATGAELDPRLHRRPARLYLAQTSRSVRCRRHDGPRQPARA